MCLLGDVQLGQCWPQRPNLDILGVAVRFLFHSCDENFPQNSRDCMRGDVLLELVVPKPRGTGVSIVVRSLG